MGIIFLRNNKFALLITYFYIYCSAILKFISVQTEKLKNSIKKVKV